MFEKEELKQEAEDFVMGIKAKEAIQKQIPYFDFAQKMYLAGAEPREKRIAELETQLEQAKEIIKDLLNSCFGYNSKTVNYEVKAKAEQFLKEE